jgi:hypothetical protein
MKKILVSTLLLLSFAGSAFAAPLATNTVSNEGVSIFGGVDAAAALAAPSPLVKFSKGVRGVVQFTTTSYTIVTKHDTGNKASGTTHDSSAMFWRQAGAGQLVAAMYVGADLSASKFVGNGWTAY